MTALVESICDDEWYSTHKYKYTLPNHVISNIIIPNNPDYKLIFLRSVSVCQVINFMYTPHCVHSLIHSFSAAALPFVHIFRHSLTTLQNQPPDVQCINSSACHLTTDLDDPDVRHAQMFHWIMSWKARAHRTVLDLSAIADIELMVLRCHNMQLISSDNVWLHFCEPQLIPPFETMTTWEIHQFKPDQYPNRRMLSIL